MSVAIIKRSGVKVPYSEALFDVYKKDFSAGHSIGYGFYRKHKFYIRKGYTFFTTFEKDFKKDNITIEDILFIYFRLY